MTTTHRVDKEGLCVGFSCCEGGRGQGGGVVTQGVSDGGTGGGAVGGLAAVTVTARAARGGQGVQDGLQVH